MNKQENLKKGYRPLFTYLIKELSTKMNLNLWNRKLLINY